MPEPDGLCNSGQGMSFQSVNFPGLFLRTFSNVLYVANNGGANPWDTASDWGEDSSWVVAQPWAQPPVGGGN